MAIPLPGPDRLPAGPPRDFVVALHDLYDQAGQPAARVISKDTFRLPSRLEQVSHQTISATLHGAALPAWGKVKSIVVALAERADLETDERELDARFKPLWIAAREAARIRGEQGPPDIPVVEDRPSAPEIHPETSPRAIRAEVLGPSIELPTSMPLSPIVGGLPDRDSDFTGRETLLDQMRTELLNNQHLPLVLHGVSGVGKSQLAREYLERHGHHYQIRWWVQAEEVAAARRSLADLADRLGVGTGHSTDQTIDAVIGRLESQLAPYLIVFDAAGEEGVRRLMPTFGGHVIVTTRDPAWGYDSSSIGVEVPDFSEDEAVGFLRRRDPSLSDEQAEDLVRRIGLLPLALAHVAALRQAPGLSWEEVLRHLDASTEQRTASGQPMPYPPHVLASVEFALRTFGDTNYVALLVLELFAWFGSEPVSVALLRQGRAGEVSPALLRALRNPVDLPKALQAIQQFGLARMHTDQRIEVHPMTRRALRDLLTQQELERALRNTHEILAAADRSTPHDVVSTGMHREIAPHVLPAALIGSRSEAVLETVYRQVRYRYLVGDYAGAGGLAESAVIAWKADPALGPADSLVLRTTKEWANALRALGQYPRARELTAEAMDLLRSDQRYGHDHPLTLSMSSSHASDLRIAGEYQRALDVDQDTLARCVDQYGPEDPRTADSRHNLAVSLRHVGDFGAAEAEDRTTLEYQRKAHGPDDYRTQLSVNGLAEDLYGLGQYAAVLELQLDHAPGSVRLPGQMVLGALLFRRTLALSRRGRGELAEALAELGDHYRECTTAFGADHEYTLAAMVSYANALRRNGDANQAFIHGSDAVLAYTRTFGRRNPLTLAAEVNLAATLRARGDRIRARQTDAAAREALRNTLGEGHPFTVVATANLATDYSLEDQHADTARELSEHALALARAVRGAEHPDTLAIGANLVLDRAAAGDPGGSTALRDELLVLLRRQPGPAHPVAAEITHGRRVECDLEPPSA